MKHKHERRTEIRPTLSYSARLAGVPIAARLGRILGLTWQQLGEHLGREVILEQLRQIEHGAARDPAGRPLDIVFATMMGGHTHFMAMEAVLALGLEARGHRVSFILCDQAFPLCEIKKSEVQPDWDRLCGKCYAFGRKFLEAGGFEVHRASELSRQARSDDRWREIVDSAVLKHFRVGVIEEETPSIRERRELLRESAAISAAMGGALIARAPDRVVMTHGIYTTWGPMRALLNEAGIPVITYDKAKKKDTWNFNWTHESAWWDVDDEWERVRDRPLNSEQDRRLDDYLSSRRSHSNDVLRYNFGEEESVAEVRRHLRLDPDKPTYVLFTNVLWDAASTDREVVFDDPVEWVIETISWFADHPERQLVVKIHPAEVVIGTNQPFASLIRQRLPGLPPNVRLIEPAEKVNSWSILRVADLGIVHTSTVGLEMPLEGIPCVVVSRTHYRGCGFTIDAESRSEYFEVLGQWSPERIDRERMRTLARRFAYLLFERYQIPFPYIHELGYSDVRSLNIENVEDLIRPGVLRMLVEAVERMKPFLLPLESNHEPEVDVTADLPSVVKKRHRFRSFPKSVS